MNKALALYKFVHDNGLEYHCHYAKKDVGLLIPTDLIDEFCEVIGEGYLSDRYIECTLRYRHIGVEMNDICESFGATLEDIFGKGYEEK